MSNTHHATTLNDGMPDDFDGNINDGEPQPTGAGAPAAEQGRRAACGAPTRPQSPARRRSGDPEVPAVSRRLPSARPRPPAAAAPAVAEEASALHRERWMRRIQKVTERNEAVQKRALGEQRDQLVRAHEAQLRRMRRDQDDELRRVRVDARSREEQLRRQLEQLRGQLEQLQQRASLSDLGPLLSEVTQLSAEKRRIEQQLQSAVELNQLNGDLLRQMHDTNENEQRKNEKQNKNDACEQMDELRVNDAAISDLREQSADSRSQLDDTLDPAHPDKQLQVQLAEASRRSAGLQLQTVQLRATLYQLRRSHTRHTRKLERKIKRMEGEVRPVRLRLKRTVARLRPIQQRAAGEEEKPRNITDPIQQKSPTRQPASPKRRKPASPAVDSDEVVQLRRQVDELQECIAQLRQSTQSKIRRPAQLYPPRPHRLLQGKMGGLPTLKENELYDSMEDSGTDTDTGCDISDIHLSDLAELSREQLQQMCCQLQRAHQQLRQAHDLLVAKVKDPSRPGSRGRARIENELLAAQSLVRDLEAALASKGVDPSALHEKSVLTAQNLRLTQKLRELRSREVKVKHELQELRDMNELMEFRILELEGCQEKSGESSPSGIAALPVGSEPHQHEMVRTEPDCPRDASQTLEAAGEDRRLCPASTPTTSGIEPTPPTPPTTQSAQPASQQQQLDSLGEERHQWQQKIASLQNTILQLEAALEETHAHQQLQQLQQLHLEQQQGLQRLEHQPTDHQQHRQLAAGESEHTVTVSSPSPPTTTPLSGHQRQPSGHSESELSDYHSDSNDGRAPASALCACGRVTRALSSPESIPLQESGIFDVDSDEKSCQTDVQQSDVSMRELIDLSSEIARLTSVQEQLEASPLQPATSPSVHHSTQSAADPLTQVVGEAEPCHTRARTASVCAEVQTDYFHDQLLCDYRDMCDRYEKMKKCKNEVEEEKNELEEAENDARLMVQRLEMKIFASTEVEKMLSSDLAEEQERCRQLQRQLNSVKLKHQADMKSRQTDTARAATAERIQQLEKTVEELTAQLESSRQLADSLKQAEQESATDCTLSPASTEAAWEVWRSTEPSSSDTMSSAEQCASGSAASLSAEAQEAAPATSRTESLAQHLHQAWSFNDSGVGEELPRASDAADADVTSLSAPASSRPAKRPRTEGQADDLDTASMVTDISMCSECSKKITADNAEAMNATVEAADTTNKNSLDSNLSERESYYSDCIQELETQKADIRKRWEEEKSSLLRQVDESCQESCGLKQQIEEILRDGEKTKQSLTQKVSELRSELRQQVSNSERDRDELVASHELKAQSLQEQQLLLRRRLRAAEDVLGALKVELELCQVEGGRDSPDISYAPVLEKVRVLHQSQRELASQVAELEKKEGAYRETLTEADRIMHNVELRYQKKIEELEDQLREGKSKLCLMEETEKRLKQALKTGGGGKHDKERITELLDKLIETEHEDLKLKEKVYRLERRERELSIKLREEERASEGLRHELRDQEELLRELDAARRELGAATEQLSALAALRQRAAELQQSEHFLRGRIEELEQAELGLQETLRGMKTAQAHKERRSAEHVHSLQQDLDSLQQTVQELQLQASEDGEQRCRLRRELQQVQRDLENTNGTATEAETQFRNEVCKLRNQLSLVNSQLTDNDSYSCQLRDQLEKVQCENCELRTALDGQKSRAEQDIIQLNLEISRREEEINALSEQLGELDKSQLTGELDLLAEQEGTLLKLLALARQSNEQLEKCSTCSSRVDGALRQVVLQLEQLTVLLSGAGMHQSLHSQLRDAEQLACELSAGQTAGQGPPPAVSTASAGVQTAGMQEQEAADLAQLRADLAAKEQEMALMDGQGSYLQDQLEQRDNELRQLRSRLLQSDSLLEHQRSQHSRLSHLLTQTQAERDEAASRTHTKDRLIGAVLRHLQAVLEAGQAAAIARALRQNTDADADRQDFDREMVCQILQQIVTAMRERVLQSRNTSPDQAGATSRIPRPVARSRESTPPASPLQDVPRAKVPRPRCLQPKRSARQVPPVGVARPYRTVGATESREQATLRVPPTKAGTAALPPPDNFQIIRAVGGDSLLLYWSPPEDQRITGYEIFVNNRLQQVIRNPQRTKALLPSLRLAAQMQLAIRAVGPCDAVSALAWAEFRPGHVAQKPHKPTTPAAVLKTC